MKGAFLLYKCRACGKIDKSTHVPNGHTAIFVMLGISDTPKTWGSALPGMTCAHFCDSSHYSITDFIGVEFDEPQ